MVGFGTSCRAPQAVFIFRAPVAGRVASECVAADSVRPPVPIGPPLQGQMAPVIRGRARPQLVVIPKRTTVRLPGRRIAARRLLPVTLVTPIAHRAAIEPPKKDVAYEVLMRVLVYGSALFALIAMVLAFTAPATAVGSIGLVLLCLTGLGLIALLVDYIGRKWREKKGLPPKEDRSV